jgi:hypothetical protein
MHKQRLYLCDTSLTYRICFVLCRSNTGPLLEVELELGGTDIAWKPELAGNCKGSLQALVQRWLVAFLEVSCLRTACIGQGMPCKKWLQLCMKRSCADAGVQLRVMHVLNAARSTLPCRAPGYMTCTGGGPHQAPGHW